MKAVVLFFFLVILTVAQSQQRCPNEWIYFENSCYAFLDEVVPWTIAADFCSILNPKSRLLEVTSKAENDFIAAQIRSRSGLSAAWQGINDLMREGRWVYNSNGEEITYSNWAHGQPNDNHAHENGEDCVQIQSDGTWDDLWCTDYERTYRPSPVCEVDKQQLIPTGQTVSVKSNAAYLDACRDADLRCPNDWVYFQSSCYAFLDEAVPWTSARDFCSILNPNSKLLEINTKAENDFVAGQIRSRSCITKVWLGINDLLREGRWVYNSNDEEITYSNWNHGEPNDNHRVENGQDCIEIYSDGTWDDRWCEQAGGDDFPSPACELDATERELVG